MAELAMVQLRDGRLHIPASVFDDLLAGAVAVALLARDGAWWLLPLQGGAGGLQLKLRNPRGDRVVEAREFFREQGLEDGRQARAFALRHDASRGAFELCEPST